MPHLNWTRTQHPVGQGFFHSGEIVADDQRQLTYVYDCGSVGAHKIARTKCIESYITQHKETKPEGYLDFLFISHLHYDHISGVAQLLDNKGGVKVDTVVLPLLSPVERLIAFAQTLEEGALGGEEGTPSTGFYQAFIVNPTQTLESFGVRQILSVNTGDRPSEGLPDGRPEGPDIGGPDGGEGGISLTWRLIGKGTVTKAPAAHNTYTIVDTSSLAAQVGGLNWLFFPFVPKVVKNKSNVFLETLAKSLDLSTKDDFIEKLNDLKFFKDLITKTDRKKKLVDAYKDIAAEENLNLTSMCLYIGPEHARGLNFFEWSRYRASFFSRTWMHHHERGECLGAWLGTGDAELGSPAQFRELIRHYKPFLPHVTTMTVPHHGSERNLHKDMLKRIRPALCVVAADTSHQKTKVWRHPSHTVTQIIGSVGAFLVTVTAQRTSELQETMYYR